MSKPVISNISSVLTCLQNQAFNFQPYASGAPTAWSATHLPAGLSIDATSGLISGAPTAPGVYVFGATATNSDGDSAPQVFAMGVQPSSALVAATCIEVVIDFATRLASIYGGTAAAAASSSTSASATASALPAALWTQRFNDGLYIHVTFIKNGVPAAGVNITSLQFALKEIDGDEPVVSSSSFAAASPGFVLHGSFSGAPLQAALQNYASDDGAAFVGLAEFEWVETLADTVTTVRGSTLPFGVKIWDSVNA